MGCEREGERMRMNGSFINRGKSHVKQSGKQ